MGVSVRHNSRLAAVVALVAAVMTVAWFARALQTGSISDWFWCVVVAAVGVLQLLVVRDGRAPLMLADEHGVRVRHGETWSGLRWQDIAHVDVQSPGSWLRDGRIVVVPRPVVAPESILDEGSEESDAEPDVPSTQAESFVVPLGVTTRVEADGLTGDLVTDLDALASGRVPVLVVTRMEPEKAETTEPRSWSLTPRSPRSRRRPRGSRARRSVPPVRRPSWHEAELHEAELRQSRARDEPRLHRDRAAATERDRADRSGRGGGAGARAGARVRPGRARPRDPARRTVRGLARVRAPAARPADDPGPALLGRPGAGGPRRRPRAAARSDPPRTP